MKLYDSFSKQLVEIQPQVVSMYNCGPTVYNDVHIGNLRPLITFDVLYRLLILLNKDVTYLHNITDIDDKIINKAKTLQQTEKMVATYYENQYLQIMSQLQVLSMTLPKVSDHIQTIIDYIQKLIILGYAYEVNGDVYFLVNKIQSYGQLSNQSLDELRKDVRKVNKDNKQNPLDFVLWKKTDTGLNWSSPWSQGRPGWHTECAALIDKIIGKKVLIHGGGIDLKFPHHENENAQNIAINNCQLADIWVHVGHVNIDNVKMSKSVGNFVLAKELLLEYSPQTIRWFFYQTKYENPINFSKELMENCQQDLQKIELLINQIKTQFIINDFNYQKCQDQNANFLAALEDDLNFPNAIKNIYEIIKKINENIRNKNYFKSQKFLNELVNGLELLGIIFIDRFNSETKKLISQYREAVKNKDFRTSDLLRAKLQEKKVI